MGPHARGVVKMSTFADVVAWSFEKALQGGDALDLAGMKHAHRLVEILVPQRN